MDLQCLFLISAVFILEQVPGSHEHRSPPLTTAPQIHRREKRCSCENLKDKECVYFCHIGIVWVDTPSQVIPYGLGSRLRRDTYRCHCTKLEDKKCLQFCSYLPVLKDDENRSFRRHQSINYKEQYKYGFPPKFRRHSRMQTT